MKQWYQSKTIWVAVATVALGMVQSAQPFISDPTILGYAVTVIGALNWVLRVLTSKPVDMGDGSDEI